MKKASGKGPGETQVRRIKFTTATKSHFPPRWCAANASYGYVALRSLTYKFGVFSANGRLTNLDPSASHLQRKSGIRPNYIFLVYRRQRINILPDIFRFLPISPAFSPNLEVGSSLCLVATSRGVLRKSITMTDKLLTIDELSEALGGIGRASIYRHIKGLPGFPQPVKVGAATRFRQSDVQAFIRGEHLAVETG